MDGTYAKEIVIVLESNLDHLTGEELGEAIDRLMESGALDVLWLPGIMKKGRPGGLLRVICRPDDENTVAAAFFRHTHTLGIRRMPVERLVLPRGAGERRVAGENLAAKVYELEGETYVRPEHAALSSKARKDGVGIPGLRLKGDA